MMVRVMAGRVGASALQQSLEGERRVVARLDRLARALTV